MQQTTKSPAPQHPHPATAVKKRAPVVVESIFGALAVFLALVVIMIVLIVKDHRLQAQLAQTQDQLNQAKTEASQAENQLAAAKDATSQLQTQLDKANGQIQDLQAQLQHAKDGATDLQAQLDRSKTQAADLQAQLDKSKAQAADLQAQLNQTDSGTSQLLTQLDQAKIQTMDLQGRLQKAEADLTQLQPLLLKARHMPITTSLEKTHGGRSFTLHVNNLIQQPVSVAIAVSGPQTRSQNNVIGAGAALKVEDLAGGDDIIISSDGYDPVNVFVQ